MTKLFSIVALFLFVACNDHPDAEATSGISASTTLSVSLSTLALETNGTPRFITITNTGSAEAVDVNYSTSGFPTGTTMSPASCENIAASDTCQLTIHPGANASNTPTSVSVVGANTNTVSSDIYILAYTSAYAGGYIFTMIDTSPEAQSTHGSVVTTSDISSGIAWDNGTFVTTNAQSLTDGATNTATIVAALGAGNYAAALCANYTIDSLGNSPCASGTCYSNWYLPSICQLGSTGEGAGCTSGDAIATYFGSGLSGLYWSSTETTNSPQNTSWLEDFSNSEQLEEVKSDALKVRCVRDF